MKTFEQKWTAWLDGQLSGRELSEFEASLPDKAAAEAEKAEARKLGALLKRELGVSALRKLLSHLTLLPPLRTISISPRWDRPIPAVRRSSA
jgi:hypothetical protein